MKRIKSIFGKSLLLLLVTSLALCSVSCRDSGGDVTAKLRDLGIPLAEQYPDDSEANIRARCSWDMTVFDGNLYVGCGDYDTNMGPVPVWSLDTATETWRAAVEPLPDEHIKRYAVIGETLCILGTDSKGEWDMGSFYTLSDGEWKEHRVLPSGIHCFDTVEYDGKLFFGLGVNSGDYPVVVSEDGETFSPVPFLRDGAPLDTSASFVRVYNFCVYNGTLHAFLTLGEEGAIAYDVYRYEANAFHYFSTPPEIFLRNYDIAYTGSYAGLATFVNGYCYYYSEDMTNFRPCRVEMSDLACDMMVLDGTLYALAYTVLEDGYESAVYASQDGKEFTKLFYFRDEIPANRFAYADGTFYFSMGRYYDAASSKVGQVLAFDYRLKD